MVMPVPAANRASWVELDLEVPPEDEERVAAALWACGSVGAWTIRDGLVRGYFDERAEDVEARFQAAWREVAGEEWSGVLRSRSAPGSDWLARWRAGVRPVAVTPTLWVAPPESAPGPAADPERRVVVIQPGQGFGTGSHPTTQALLRWIETEPGERVLDLGCGSGVLAIAALALGARLAVGLDVDGEAIANADENRRRNAVTSRLHLARGDLDALAPGARFDRVLANLDGQTLRRLAGAILARCEPGGRIGVAGLLAEEREAFLDSLRPRPVEIVDERTDPDPSGSGAWWSAWLAPPKVP